MRLTDEWQISTASYPLRELKLGASPSPLLVRPYARYGLDALDGGAKHNEPFYLLSLDARKPLLARNVTNREEDRLLARGLDDPPAEDDDDYYASSFGFDDATGPAGTTRRPERKIFARFQVLSLVLL